MLSILYFTLGRLHCSLAPAVFSRYLPEKIRGNRKPFEKSGSDRQPTLSWPRQIPLDGKPSDVHDIVEKYSNFMSANNINKLFINANPGSILLGRQREICRKWKNQKEVTVKGIHFIQEDSSPEIARAIKEWIGKDF